MTYEFMNQILFVKIRVALTCKTRWVDGTPTSEVTLVTYQLYPVCRNDLEKLKVKAKVKTDGHIWGLVFN